MRIKKAWFILVPSFLLMTAIKLYQKYVEHTGYSFPPFESKDSIIASYATIMVVFFTFFVLCILSLTDRQTAPVYSIKKNLSAGAVCLFTASVAVIDLGCFLSEAMLIGNISVSMVINVIFSGAAAFGFFILSWIHVSARKPNYKMAIYLVLIPMWAIVRLISFFISNSSISVAMTDVMEIFTYLFIALYMFNVINVVSVIKQKNPVKRLFVFGIPALALLGTYDAAVAADLYLKGYTTGYYTKILVAVELTLIAAYIFIFNFELTKNAKNLKTVKIIETNEQILELFEERKAENIRRFEKKRKEARNLGDFYITSESAYDSNNPVLSDEGYGYYSSGTYRQSDSYVNEEDDTFIIGGATEDESDRRDKDSSKTYFNSEYQAKLRAEGKEFTDAENLMFEITTGENDLDLNEVSGKAVPPQTPVMPQPVIPHIQHETEKVHEEESKDETVPDDESVGETVEESVDEYDENREDEVQTQNPEIKPQKKAVSKKVKKFRPHKQKNRNKKKKKRK